MNHTNGANNAKPAYNHQLVQQMLGALGLPNPTPEALVGGVLHRVLEGVVEDKAPVRPKPLGASGTSRRSGMRVGAPDAAPSKARESRNRASLVDSTKTANLSSCHSIATSLKSTKLGKKGIVTLATPALLPGARFLGRSDGAALRDDQAQVACEPDM